MKIYNTIGFLYSHKINNVMHPKQHIFEFFSHETKEKLGELVCHKSEINLRPNYNGSVLAVDYIESTIKNCGFGTKMLDFAKLFSQSMECAGYITIKADGSKTPDRIPHIFYRKYGFSSFDKQTDKKLDLYIKTGKNATTKDFPCLLMHYPPNQKHFNFLDILSKFTSF